VIKELMMEGMMEWMIGLMVDQNRKFLPF